MVGKGYYRNNEDVLERRPWKGMLSETLNAIIDGDNTHARILTSEIVK